MTVGANKKKLKAQKSKKDSKVASRVSEANGGEAESKAQEEEIYRNPDEQPYAAGAIVQAAWVDGSPRYCTVIDSAKMRGRETANGEPMYTYYVHYLDFNRRMDEWIDGDRILKPPSVATAEVNAMKNASEVASEVTSVSAGDVDEINSASRKRKLNEGDDSQVEPSTVHDLEHDEHEGLDEAQLKEHEEVTKVKNVKKVQFGRHILECWYFSPFPKEYYPDGPVDCLYFCEFTMRFFRTAEELHHYQSNPELPRHPPGNEIYRDDQFHLSVFEIDGAVEKIYCQNLCYFAKLFLDHKTLYFDVDPFLFYVICESDNQGYHPVGYFSKEKYSDLGYNLACILTFPSHQRKGYGRFIINFSYELSKKEEKVGSPEKPLSDLGAVSYRSYWASTLLTVLKQFPGSQLSIMDLSKMTAIVSEDVIGTLQSLGLLRYVNGAHVIYAPPDLVEELIRKYPQKEPIVDPSKLHWAPLVQDVKHDKWSFRSKVPTNEST